MLDVIVGIPRVDFPEVWCSDTKQLGQVVERWQRTAPAVGVSDGLCSCGS